MHTCNWNYVNVKLNGTSQVRKCLVVQYENMVNTVIHGEIILSNKVITGGNQCCLLLFLTKEKLISSAPWLVTLW